MTSQAEYTVVLIYKLHVLLAEYFVPAVSHSEQWFMFLLLIYLNSLDTRDDNTFSRALQTFSPWALFWFFLISTET